MKNLMGKWFTEKTIFYSVLAFNLFLMLTIKFYPSLDGPSHLYNSNLINHLIGNTSQVINDYFVLNKTILPNWISYFILSTFNSFLPAWLAEKILLILYLFGIAISFRLLIKQLSPKNIGLSIFIFPFAYSFLFHLGFYNYAFSFIFLFLTLHYWIKNYNENSLTKYIVLFVLLTLTYFSAILTFFFLGFCLGLFVLAYSLKDYFCRKERTQVVRRLFKELLFLFIASLPALIFSFIFVKSTIFFPSDHNYTATELVKWLFDVRCLIVYDYPGDEILTRQFFHISIAILCISFFIRFFNKALLDWKKIRRSDVFIIPALFGLVLLFIVPNGSSSGMMSDRFCLLFYIFFIIWVSSQAMPRSINNVFIVLIIAFHLGLLFKHHNGVIRDLNKKAQSIYNASKYVEENSIVLSVDLSEDWLELHFSDYLGVDKPLVILENYEASVGWFPIKWDMQKIPNIKLGEYNSIKGVMWPTNSGSSLSKQIDYVFVYGKLDKIEDPNWAELKAILFSNYILTFISQDQYLAIYKVKS